MYRWQFLEAGPCFLGSLFVICVLLKFGVSSDFLQGMIRLLRAFLGKLWGSLNCKCLFLSGQLQDVVCGQAEVSGPQQVGLPQNSCSWHYVDVEIVRKVSWSKSGVGKHPLGLLYSSSQPGRTLIWVTSVTVNVYCYSVTRLWCPLWMRQSCRNPVPTQREQRVSSVVV